MNTMELIGVPLEVKELSDSGSFEGLASVYGNVDLGGDIVEAGAFREFNKTKDGYVRILDSHNTRAPIGKGMVTDTHIGLAIRAQLNLKVARARDVYELMKDNIIDGLSIGYDVMDGGSFIDDQNIRHLTNLKLWEVSTTIFPMNQSAMVSSVKGLERVNSVREVEDWLRDVVCLSRSQAKHHAGEIWKTLTGRREVDAVEVSDEVQKLIGAIGKYTSL